MRLIRVLLALAAVCAPLVIDAPSAAATTRSVTISGYTFSPAALTVTAGDTVSWTNQDSAPHDVTTTSAPVAIHGSTMTRRQSWSYTFTTPGTYSYICSIHPDMKATVTVLAAAATHSATHPAPPAPRQTTVLRRLVAQPQVPPRRYTSSAARRGARTSTAAPSTVTAAASPANAAPVAAGPPGASDSMRPLRPLLIVAGIIAAVATVALLMLVSRPTDDG